MTVLLAAVLAVQEDEIRPPELRELQAIQEEIGAVALLKRAQVSREQAAHLLELVEEGRRKLEAIVRENREAIGRFVETGRELRDSLARGEIPDEELRAKADGARRAAEDLRRRMEAELAPLGERVKDILRPEQIAVLRMPPAAEGLLRQVRQGLDRVRTLTEDEFELTVPTALEEQLESFADRLGGLSDDEFNREFDRVLGILREVRRLTEEEFPKKADELARRIVLEGELGRRLAAQTAGRRTPSLAEIFTRPATIRALRTISKGE